MRVALLTVSDSASTGDASDLSGPLLHKLVAEGGRTVVRADVLPDERQEIAMWLCEVADTLKVDLALTSGGTGLGPRDVTPEATLDVIDVEAPGIAEAIRADGLKVTPRAMLSRGVAGVRGQTLIVNLSGSPKAVTQQWATIEPIIEHAVQTVRGRGHHPETDAERARPPVVQEESSSVVTFNPSGGGRSSSRMQTLVGQPLTDMLGDDSKKEE